MTEIYALPDYPAIKKIAAALWGQSIQRHGAAILVGAGFSRCSAHHIDGKKRLPLWQDFAKKLANELDPYDTNLVFSDPLRLAEEYRSYFGQAALNDLIRMEINDNAWSPSELHQSLLKLPWSEIMTTNWDTLLERAAKKNYSPVYSLVSKQSDIACVRSPRIIKLHGSIGSTDHFIVAQEDYRKYPQTFAAFVNLARQIFIENELCLLGFSGDDPNFLQWAGWVRDHLADHSRRIYLVGALNLTAAKRKHLESLNIAPIDLWELESVKSFDDHDLKHRKATEIFLEILLSEKPKYPFEWEPTNLHPSSVKNEDIDRIYKDHDYASSILESQLPTLQHDRETYPSWLVCPQALQRQLRSQINYPFPNSQNMATLTPLTRAKILYEIAWRYSIAYVELPQWLIEPLANISDFGVSDVLSKRQKVEILLLLLRNLRWNAGRDESCEIEIKRIIDLIETNAQHYPDSIAEVAYHRALVARDEFDYNTLEMLVEKIKGEDVVWKLRKASFFAELGRFEEGEHLLIETYNELRDQHRHAPNSIFILSRLAWAHWLLRGTQIWKSNKKVDEFPAIYKDWECDPWSYIDHIKDEASEQKEKYLESLEDVKPLFEQGYYTDNTSKTYTTKMPVTLFLDGLTQTVGIPLRWEHTSFFTDVLSKLIISDDSVDELLRYSRSIQIASSDTSQIIKDVFSRIGVARASQEVIGIVTDRVIKAIEYWRSKRASGSQQEKNYALDRIRVFIEVLARISIRQSPEKAKQLFLLALELGQEPSLQHHWLCEVLDHLITYSQQSIPKSQQAELLFETLSFPLITELNDVSATHVVNRWPNPVIKTLVARVHDLSMDKRINELIDSVASDSSSRIQAVRRLQPLVDNSFLYGAELTKLAKKIWGNEPDYAKIPDVGLYPHGLCLLPAEDFNTVKLLVKNYLFEAEDKLLLTPEHLMGIANAAANKKTRMFPNREQATKYFDFLVQWRPSENRDDPFGLIRQRKVQLLEGISNALSYAIVPALVLEDITLERFGELLAFYEMASTIVPVISIALVYFANLNDEVRNKVEKLVRKGLQGKIPNEVNYAAQTLLKWKKLAEEGKLSQPRALIQRLVYLIESERITGLQSLLRVVREMFKKDWLAEDEIITLIEALPSLFNSANYYNVNPMGKEAIGVSSIREQCIKLAKDIIAVRADQKELIEIIELAKEDALPEVRFAAID